jgi:hypothetical protein
MPIPRRLQAPTGARLDGSFTGARRTWRFDMANAPPRRSGRPRATSRKIGADGCRRRLVA